MAEREHFTNGSVAAFGAGLALMVAAFTTQITGWSHWITIGITYGIGGTLVLLSAGKVMMSYHSPHVTPEHEAREEVGNKVGRDNKGRMTQAASIGSYYEAPTPIPVEPAAPKPPLKIDFEAKERILWLAYQASSGRWGECVPDIRIGNKSLVIDLIRPKPGKGEPPIGGMNLDLVASLRLKHSYLSEYVPMAYWVDAVDGDINFRSGERHSLLIGILRPSAFVSYINPIRGTVATDYFHVPIRELGKAVELPKSETIDVEISLFAQREQSTVDEITFQISFDGEQPHVKRLQ
jgi:hypothetical protein